MSRRNNNQEEESKQQEQKAEGGEGGASASGKVTGRFAQLISTAAKLPTAYATGAPIEIPSVEYAVNAAGDGKELKLSSMQDRAPGVLVYDWVPTIGVSTSNSSPANLAMAEIASFIKSQVNRRPAWETPDLAIAMLAIDSIYSLHFSLMRVYGLINKYTALNKYWPRAVIESMGFDFDDFRNNQVNLLFMLQQRAAELRRLALPATFRLFERHLRFNSLVFADGETEKAQLYVINQSCFWSYEVVDQVKGLTPIRIQSPLGDGELSGKPYRKLKYADMVGIYDRMLTALRNSSDIDVIVGDIVSAYGDAAISLIPEMAADYTTPIVYDPALLCSINNACIYNADTNSLRVEDKGGNYLYCQPKCTVSETDGGWASATIGNMPYLNFHPDVPTEQDVVNAMLFHAWVGNVKLVRATPTTPTTFDPVTHTSYDVVACGTELITNARLYVLPLGEVVALDSDDSCPERPDLDSEYHVYEMQQFLLSEAYSVDDGTVTSHMSTVLMTIARLSAFKAHHPVAIVNLARSSDRGLSFTSSPFICSTQNRVPITSTNVEQLFTALLYDAFFN